MSINTKTIYRNKEENEEKDLRKALDKYNSPLSSQTLKRNNKAQFTVYMYLYYRYLFERIMCIA